MADDKSRKIEKNDSEWREKLTPEQYAVTREAGTERAFTGPWVNEHRDGTYKCVCCGAQWFRSETTHDSGSGCPGHYDAIDKGAVWL